MSVSDWLRVFRTMHDHAMRGELSGTDLDDYRAGCDELARALIGARRGVVRPGEVPRHVLQVARAVQVNLESPLASIRATTVDLSVGGFTALLDQPPAAGEELECLVRLPGADPLSTQVVPGEVKRQPHNFRVAFRFVRLDEAARQRLERLVIDTALSQLAS